MRLACELLRSRKDGLHVIYIIEVERRLPIDAEIAPAIAKGEEVLNHMEQISKSYKCRADGEIVQARESGAALVQEAVTRSVDTIVLSTTYRQRHGGEFFIDKTASYVLKNAPCRVIMWHDPIFGAHGNGRGA